MKLPKFHIIAVILLSAASLLPDFCASAQERKPGYVMPYVVNGRDTVFLDDVPPAVVSPRKKGLSKRQWRKYYKRVHNFSKAYPYAQFVSRMIHQTDSVFEARGYSKRQKEKYLERLKEDLLSECEPIFRNLTLAQGMMMIRLIDREVGLTPYYILKYYFSTPMAAFWQGFAKLFKGDLKQPYDRFGEDRDLEELVGIWEKGEFDFLYFSIFGKPRPSIYIPEKFR